MKKPRTRTPKIKLTPAGEFQAAREACDDLLASLDALDKAPEKDPRFKRRGALHKRIAVAIERLDAARKALPITGRMVVESPMFKAIVEMIGKGSPETARRIKEVAERVAKEDDPN